MAWPPGKECVGEVLREFFKKDDPVMNLFHKSIRGISTWCVVAGGLLFLPVIGAGAGAGPGGEGVEDSFSKQIRPMLEDLCFECHGEGSKKGGFAMDTFASLEAHLKDSKHWYTVWKNVESQLMPPASKPQPTPDQRQALLRWIEQKVFRLDPQNPDPGRVTVRRLNREEYRNSIMDLLEVRFETEEAFPADDTGYGFDTIGDVLTISPLLMEKYLMAAQQIAHKAVFESGPRLPQVVLGGEQLQVEGGGQKTGKAASFSEHVTLRGVVPISRAGPHELSLLLRTMGSPEATEHTARVVLRAGKRLVAEVKLGWDQRKQTVLAGDTELKAGPLEVEVEVIPGTPPAEGQKPLSLRVESVTVSGPKDGGHWEYGREFYRVFPDGPFQGTEEAKQAYRKRILGNLARRAFRRPVDEGTLERLERIATQAEKEPGGRFETGIAQALQAILVSPRFLFRAEIQPEPDQPGRVVWLDEFSLASRLSYFLWCSVPDEELLRLAGEGALRKNLRAQVDRMLADPRGTRWVQHFVGQWLQVRDVEAIHVDADRVLGKEAARHFSGIRTAMREETMLFFTHLLKENRPVSELLTANYTFLNERLADFYGVPGVQGAHMRKVFLPEGSPRQGGVLTQGSFLLVTSNPTRTSPVKRGLFILENLLGMPAPPPPPNVPELENAKKAASNPTMREMMEIHRKDPLCASCHARMDPLGLALEGFNAVGAFRQSEQGKPIETAGQLITGEKFENPGQLGRVIATARRGDFHRCVSEKVLTYALGRGLEYYDTVTLHQVVEGFEKEQATLRALIYQVVESAPFQKRRGDGSPMLAR